jgi:hypothetical protein
MIIVRRVKHRNQLASFNALVYGAAAVGGAGLGALYGRSQLRQNNREYLEKHPKVRQGLLILLRPEAAIGIGAGKTFSRRRRTKNGKVIVEQVRRK